MALRRSDLTSYWRGSNGGLLKERKKWVEENQSRCLGVCDDASLQVSLALREIALLSEVDESRIERLAVEVEPDWTLLSRASGLWRIVAGAVVFPSSWALNEKLGRPLFEVHGPIPGLNPTLGASIDIFLDSLTQFTAWERWNWGLAADSELNHHPSRNLPGLAPGVRINNVWVRLENQHLCLLQCGLILFGIRVSCHRLDKLVENVPGLAPRIANSLETMMEDVALYKGVSDARAGIISALRAISGNS